MRAFVYIAVEVHPNLSISGEHFKHNSMAPD